jgi:hypothetical protein
MHRVIVISRVHSPEELELIREHGEVVVLEEVLPEKPSQWEAHSFCKWLADALALAKYEHGRDFIALQGNYLAIAQLIAVVAYQEPDDECVIHVLNFSKANGVKHYVKHTFYCNEVSSIHAPYVNC